MKNDQRIIEKLKLHQDISLQLCKMNRGMTPSKRPKKRVGE